MTERSQVVISPTKSILWKKIKTLQQKLRRKEKKISDMKGVISDLKESKLINNDDATVLQKNFSGLPFDIFKNQIHNQNV